MRHFFKKFNEFTSNNVDVEIKWITKKVKYLHRKG